MRQKMLVAGTVAVAVMFGACAKGPESVVEDFYAAVGKGDFSEAQGFLSGNILQMLPPAKIAAGFSQEHEKIVACGGIKNVKVDLQGEGDARSGTATVSYRGDCPDEIEEVKLAREEGAWRLQAAK